MITSKAQRPSTVVWEIAKASFLAVVLGLFFCALLCSRQLAYSLVLGVSLWMLPNVYVADKLFRCSSITAPAALLRIFYQAEIRKLLWSGFFFVMMIRLMPTAHVPAMVVGYLLAQLIFWMRFVVMLDREALG